MRSWTSDGAFVDDTEGTVRTNGIGVDVARDVPCNTVPVRNKPRMRG